MLNFPSSPTIGQIYTYGVRSWVWSGAVWAAAPSSGPPGAEGAKGDQGIPGPAPSGTGFVYVESGVASSTLNFDAGTF